MSGEKKGNGETLRMKRQLASRTTARRPLAVLELEVPYDQDPADAAFFFIRAYIGPVSDNVVSSCLVHDQRHHVVNPS